MNDNNFAVNQARVVISTGGDCSNDCVYCIARAADYKKEARSAGKMLKLIERLCKNKKLKTIQLGYDTEPFKNQKAGLGFVKKILKFGKNITFATKAELSKKTAKELGRINKRLGQKGKHLCAVVSLSCWASAGKIEPSAPTPEKRLNTIRRLHVQGVQGIVALKPVMPFISTLELRRVLREAKAANAKAVVIGEFDLDKKGKILEKIKAAGFSINEKRLMEGTLCWTTKPGLKWNVYRDPRIKTLFGFSESIGLPAFSQTIEAVNHIIKN